LANSHLLCGEVNVNATILVVGRCYFRVLS
jgi:hypothetical protein